MQHITNTNHFDDIKLPTSFSRTSVVQIWGEKTSNLANDFGAQNPFLWCVKLWANITTSVTIKAKKLTLQKYIFDENAGKRPFNLCTKQVITVSLEDGTKRVTPVVRKQGTNLCTNR